MQIEILNWKEYNGRHDVTNPSWFRLSNRLFYDPDWMDMCAEELIVWFYLLSHASFKSKKDMPAIFNIELRQLSVLSRVKPVFCESAIKKLQEKHAITATLRGRYVDVTLMDEISTYPTDRQTDTTLQLQASPPAQIVTEKFDFEEVYKGYPLKKGKSKGMKLCMSQIKTLDDYQSLVTAVKNYAKEVHGSENRYIKHFSTFMNCWRDYLEEPGPSAFKQKLIDAGFKLDEGWVS